MSSLALMANTADADAAAAAWFAKSFYDTPCHAPRQLIPSPLSADYESLPISGNIISPTPEGALHKFG